MTSDTNQTKVVIGSESILAPQNIVPANLTTAEEQMEKWSISADQGDYNPYPAGSAYSSPYFSSCVVLTGVLTATFRHPVIQVQSIKVNYLWTADIYIF